MFSFIPRVLCHCVCFSLLIVFLDMFVAVRSLVERDINLNGAAYLNRDEKYGSISPLG